MYFLGHVSCSPFGWMGRKPAGQPDTCYCDAPGGTQPGGTQPGGTPGIFLDLVASQAGPGCQDLARPLHVRLGKFPAKTTCGQGRDWSKPLPSFPRLRSKFGSHFIAH